MTEWAALGRYFSHISLPQLPICQHARKCIIRLILLLLLLIVSMKFAPFASCILTGLTTIHLIQSWFKYRHLPPGPFHYPLIGDGLQFHNVENPVDVILGLRKQYGPIFTVGLPHPTVILAHRQAFDLMQTVEVGGALEGRPTGFVWSYFTKNQKTGAGIILSEGEEHRQLKKLAQEMTREFSGRGGVIEGRVQFYADTFIASLNGHYKNSKTGTLNPEASISETVGDIIDSFVFGDGKSTLSWKQNLDSVLANFWVANPLTQFVNAYPILYRCPLVSRSTQRYIDAGMKINGELSERVAARRKKFNPADYHLPDDYICAAMKQNPKYSDTTLIISAGDLWTGGLGTTVTLMRWAFVYFVRHPEIQTKVRAEVVKVFGCEMPSYSRKNETPYLMATIRELLRLVNVLPFAIPHRATSDVTMQIEGKEYRIPKGTTVIPMYGVVNFDEEIFPDPYAFNPERFLNVPYGDSSNPFSFYPFGAGRRRCAGSNLAYVELYILIARLVQNFEIFPHGDNLPSLKRSTGMTNEPEPFEVILKKFELNNNNNEQ